MIDASQLKLVEVLAGGAVNAAALFFTILTLVFGMSRAAASIDRATFRWAVWASVVAVLASLIFIVCAAATLRYQTAGLYQFTLAFGSAVLIAAFGAAILFAFKASSRTA